MTKRLLLALTALAFSAGSLAAAEKVRVACVGDSITYGARLEDPKADSYPSQLQLLLGDRYEVANLGVGSCCLLRKGRPNNVWSQLDRIKASRPDIVVVSLGTNDTGGTNWDHAKEFKGDFADFVDMLRALPSKPRVILCATTPMVLETPGLSAKRKSKLKMRLPRLVKFIRDIQALVKAKKTGFIDLYTPLAGRPKLFTEKDGVHPNKAGYRRIAELVHAGLTKGK